MKSVGSYNDWVYNSSSSNLSAFAPPFSVNRSPSKDGSAPYVDLGESADAIPSNQFPVHRGYGYHYFSNPVMKLDSTPSSKTYGYSVSQIIDQPNTQLPHLNSSGVAFEDSFTSDQRSNSVKANLVEVDPYYPSHISPPINNGSSSVAHNPWSPAAGYASLDGPSLSDYTKNPPELGYSSQKGGSWNQYSEFNQDKSKQVEFGKSFCPMEANFTGSFEANLVNKGCQDVNDSNNGEHSTNMMGWEKQSVPVPTDQLDDRPCWWQTSKSMSVDFLRTSVQGSPLVPLETNYDPLLKSVGESGNHNLSFSGSHKYLVQNDKPSWVDMGSSTPITRSIYDLNVASDVADRDLGGNNFSDKEPYPLPSLGQLDCFGLSQFHTQLQRNDPVPASSISNAELSDKGVSADAVDFIFEAGAVHGFQNLHITPDNLNLTLRTNEGVSSVAKSFDSVDHCNPAIDSPCWKEAPASCASHFESSETQSPIFFMKTEDYFGSGLLGPRSCLLNTGNHVKISYETSNNNQIDYQERKLSTKSPVMNFGSEECNSNVAVDAGSCQCKASNDSRLQYVDNLSEVRENRMPPNKSIYDCESRSSSAEKKVIGENKLASQNNHDLCRGSGDDIFNVNRCLEYGTSQATGYALSSPSSVEIHPVSLKNQLGKHQLQI